MKSIEQLEQINFLSYAAFFQPRARDWHKGMSGHVLVIGGELGFSGAPRLAAEAALRVGAGLVSVATRPENAVQMNAYVPEIMCHGISNAQELQNLIAKANVLALGPGLGQSEWSEWVWEHAISAKKPLVVDADALNLLATKPLYRDDWVLTPHAGEAGRLLDQSAALVQQDRLQAVMALQKRYGGLSVLKGAGSLVLGANAAPKICVQGNPGMATAGMGDVLTGVISGLMAQGMPTQAAAECGVVLHALAGDLAARAGERGMIATDLMPYLRRLVNDASTITD